MMSKLIQKVTQNYIFRIGALQEVINDLKGRLEEEYK